MPLCGYVRGRVDTHRSQTPWIPQEVGVKDNCKLPDIDTLKFSRTAHSS